MKKFLTLILTAIVTIVISGSMTSCHRHYIDENDDVAQVTQNDVTTPTFTDADAFADYAMDESQYIEFLNKITELDRMTILTIAEASLKNNKGSITWRTWITEYKINKTVYTNMDAVFKKQRGENIELQKQSSGDTISEYKALPPSNN